MVSPFSNTLFHLLTETPHMANTVSIPMASFALWALPRRIMPSAPQLMKLFYPDSNHIGISIRTPHQNHLLLLQLQLHRHLLPTTPTPTRSRSRSRTPPPSLNTLPPLPGSSTSTPWTTSSRGSTTSTLSSALDRSHQRPLDGHIYGKPHGAGLPHRHCLRPTQLRSLHHLLLSHPRELRLGLTALPF